MGTVTSMSLMATMAMMMTLMIMMTVTFALLRVQVVVVVEAQTIDHFRRLFPRSRVVAARCITGCRLRCCG